MFDIGQVAPLDIFSLKIDGIEPRLGDVEPLSEKDTLVGELTHEERCIYTIMHRVGEAARELEQEETKALLKEILQFRKEPQALPLPDTSGSPLLRRLSNQHEMLRLTFWNQVRSRMNLWDYESVRICPNWQVAVVLKKDCGCGGGENCGAVMAGLLKPEVYPPSVMQ